MRYPHFFYPPKFFQKQTTFFPRILPAKSELSFKIPKKIPNVENMAENACRSYFAKVGGSLYIMPFRFFSWKFQLLLFLVIGSVFLYLTPLIKLFCRHRIEKIKEIAWLLKIKARTCIFSYMTIWFPVIHAVELRLSTQSH